MGDPLSPGMTIGTCAWMEQEWLKGLTPDTKRLFSAARYMDDILMLYSRSGLWRNGGFLTDFTESTCYWKPLTLEAAKENTFLETTFENHGDWFSYRCKNVNEHECQVWRYHDNGSYCSTAQKKGVIIACLRKVWEMASDDSQLWISATAKLKEFQEKGYSAPLRKHLCSILGRDTRHSMWFKIRAIQ